MVDEEAAKKGKKRVKRVREMGYVYEEEMEGTSGGIKPSGPSASLLFDLTRLYQFQTAGC